MAARSVWLASLLLLELGGSPRSENAFAASLSPKLPGRAARQEPESGASSRPGLRPQRVVAAGDYRPFYRTAPNEPLRVQAFTIDLAPVSRADFAAFVADNPAWRRSRVNVLFAEKGYLSDWLDELEPGAGAAQPVAFVSWFAAKAYCAWRGERLPTVVEWEHARLGAASAGRLWEWTLDFNGVPSSRAGAGAENPNSLFCGAGALSTDARDYDAFLRYSFRSSLRGDFALKNLGFRCAGANP
jgi:sulfatase modifying factor 1